MNESSSVPPADEVVLTINSGSSSVKFSLIGLDGTRVADGAIEGIGETKSRAWFHQGTNPVERDVSCADHRHALGLVFDFVSEDLLSRIAAVGHRVVHGGRAHREPVVIDAAVMESLRHTVALAPLHMPACIAGIEAISSRKPDLPQVACFDTAFHSTLPEVAWRLAVPERLTEVRRYGFHGLSYEYVMSTLQPPVPARIVIAHLGNGASLVAVKDGSAIDTTMSFTPTGGIPMGTRSGDLDPSILIYLSRTSGLSADALENLVDRESGLLALGGTSDMKTLLARAPLDARAAMAVDVFGYAIRKSIGALCAALGGIDLLIFTGGIGERAAPIRERACEGLEFLGLSLDRARNAADADTISTDVSRTTVRVVKTDEDVIIGRHTRDLTRGRAHATTVRR